MGGHSLWNGAVDNTKNVRQNAPKNTTFESLHNAGRETHPIPNIALDTNNQFQWTIVLSGVSVFWSQTRLCLYTGNTLGENPGDSALI